MASRGATSGMGRSETLKGGGSGDRPLLDASGRGTPSGVEDVAGVKADVELLNFDSLESEGDPAEPPRSTMGSNSPQLALPLMDGEHFLLECLEPGDCFELAALLFMDFTSRSAAPPSPVSTVGMEAPAARGARPGLNEHQVLFDASTTPPR